MAAQSFEDLLVWQKAHQYVIAIYTVTKSFPKDEMFALVNQLRRASSSITANIAEGFVRTGNREKRRFYNISQGSLEETKNFLILSKDLGYISSDVKEDLYAKASEIGKMLNAYCREMSKSL